MSSAGICFSFLRRWETVWPVMLLVSRSNMHMSFALISSRSLASARRTSLILFLFKHKTLAGNGSSLKASQSTHGNRSHHARGLAKHPESGSGTHVGRRGEGLLGAVVDGGFGDR